MVAEDEPERPTPSEAVIAVLDRSLRALGDAGQHDLACRLAAEAWARLRETNPDGAERLNRTMHYLTARMTRGRALADRSAGQLDGAVGKTR